MFCSICYKILLTFNLQWNQCWRPRQIRQASQWIYSYSFSCRFASRSDCVCKLALTMAKWTLSHVLDGTSEQSCEQRSWQSWGKNNAAIALPYLSLLNYCPLTAYLVVLCTNSMLFHTNTRLFLFSCRFNPEKFTGKILDKTGMWVIAFRCLLSENLLLLFDHDEHV